MTCQRHDQMWRLSGGYYILLQRKKKKYRSLDAQGIPGVHLKVLHLYCAFSIWMCSKAHYNDQFTPSVPKAHIGASVSRYNAVYVCWYSFYRLRKDGKLSELQRERRSHRYSTPDEANDLRVGRQRSYCANPSANPNLVHISCRSRYGSTSRRQLPLGPNRNSGHSRRAFCFNANRSRLEISQHY